MSDVELNETINGYRGSIGKLVFKKYRGRTIVSRKVLSTKPPTEGQLAQRAEFKEASAFARTVKANPDLLAFYGPIAKQREVTVRVVAMGDVIEIRAADDLGLAELNVKIVAQDGTPIESGQAFEEGDRSGKWVYTATAQVALGSDVFIEVKGVDHAGNETKLTENPTVGIDE